MEAILSVLEPKGVYLAAQCCEHLNRCLIVERSAVPGLEPVNVVPQPKAGGSFATAAYGRFRDPVAVERYPHRDAFEGGGGAGTAVPQGHWGSAFAGCESAAQVHRRGSGQI